ncbi:endolytic transglycosylase MltG [Chengkuizengella sp. 2205SS18-9]|uniref:Endolytic murein transglycosylase n=2 Tax=Chengkuizengella axinellae TaxID=3064388 RepID=A0ABT9ITY7_9BACL|nr:endolytic transglycosylase MltG [Chengkuizengella sp. 2205SS18-9]MDP5272809.1 endolytic transglycosylase MltG [Chengkuizengella sp. 2205SS18-9]
MSILSILMFLIVGFIAGVVYYGYSSLQPVEAQDESIRFTVETGMNSKQIANRLEEEGLIRNQTSFTYYLKYKKEGQRFQAGDYEMQPGITIDEIIQKLNAGETVVNTIQFTIPEGYTLEQITDKLAGEQLINSDVFSELLLQPELFSSASIKNIPDDGNMKYILEGYLFPETYEMKEESNEQDIIERMLLELDKKLTSLPENWQEQLDVLGITFHEMMTIASLIEREVVVDEERKTVSGVIFNRIRDNGLLQIDATVQYALDEPKERLLYEDLEIESPYNTYIVEGLPPGPIASPSILSIEAALYPEETSYYFYVTKKDGTQEHLFAETYSEHLSNIEKSKQMVQN